MKQRRTVKWLTLAGVIALGLTLSGCYIPPDELSDNTQGLTVGNNNLPFNTVAPVNPATDTPAPSNTPDPFASAQPTTDWNSWNNTNQPGVSATGAIGLPGTATNQPGSTIAVVTQQPTATPKPNTATPKPQSLKNGMFGSAEVKQMQQRLKELGYLSGSADGDFGDATEAAVRAFQQQNGLTVDGKAGANTLNKLYSNNAVSKPKDSATNKPTSRPTNTGKPTSTPKTDVYLESGSSGKNVRSLQNRLIELGWMAGSADGEYEGATQYAVKAYQNAAGLWADGIAGPGTLESIYSSRAKTASSPSSSIGDSLREGAKGGAVKALQKRLKSLGYLDGSADGSFGAATKTAVIAFQQQNGLNADGVAGTSTLNRIYSDAAKSGSSAGDAAGSGTVSSTGYVTLREGDKSEAVKKLQRALKDKGYYSGSVDGSYGSGTMQAVLAFQRQNNLREDGVAGPATQRSLYGSGSGKVDYATLRPGDEGTAVTNLQYTLYELGYYDGKVDGIYGATTSDAVRAFQSRNKLEPVDGIAGNKTLQKLYSSSAIPATAASTDYETLEKGDKGNEVVELQDVLQQLGYLTRDQVTGVYDTNTVEAVKLFQQYNGLNVDGKAGSATQTKLFSDNVAANPNR